MFRFLILLQSSQSRFEGLSKAFRPDESERVSLEQLANYLLALLCAVLAIWLLSRLVGQRGRRYTSPFLLFAQLCRAHRLSWKESWWLWRVAKELELEQPSELFVEPAFFNPARLGPALRAKTPLLFALQTKLFTGSPRRQESPRAIEVPTPELAPKPQPEAPSPPPRAPSPLLPSAGPPKLDLSDWWAEARGSEERGTTEEGEELRDGGRN